MSKPKSKRRKMQFKTMPVWVARVTEVVHVKGKRHANVVTKTGKPRTITLR